MIVNKLEPVPTGQDLEPYIPSEEKWTPAKPVNHRRKMETAEILPENLQAGVVASEAHVGKRQLRKARLALQPVLEYLAAKEATTPSRIQTLYARILLLEQDMLKKGEKEGV